MVTRTPLYCRPSAFSLFTAQLPQLDTVNGLVTAAVAVSLHELGDADPLAVHDEIRTIGTTIRDRVQSDQKSAILAHIHDMLFEEMGFMGNHEDYYNPENSYLPWVLEHRRGLPITLTLIYKAVAEQVGISVRGINTPWHFMAAVEIDGQMMFVDPFDAGRALNREEVFARIENTVGISVPPDDRLLAPATHGQWITRIIQNLIHVFGATQRQNDLAAMIELQALLET